MASLETTVAKLTSNVEEAKATVESLKGNKSIWLYVDNIVLCMFANTFYSVSVCRSASAGVCSAEHPGARADSAASEVL